MKMIGGFLILMLTAPTMLPAVPPASRTAFVLPEVTTYDELLASIRKARNDSQARLEAAAEQEKVREAWETGKLIDEHILHHQERAEYGRQVIMRLAKDLTTSQTELSFMLQFARAYPIYSPANNLSWAHYRELLAVNDPKERDEVTKKASENHWTRDRIRQEVKARKRKANGSANASEGPVLLDPVTPGPLDTYQIVRLKNTLKIDLGFGIYRDLDAPDAKKLKAGDIVESIKSSDGTYKLSESLAPRNESLFTYRAQVVSVVDGDTFHTLIDLGFGITMAQRIRLRRVDAPEILTAEGKEAKAALEKILSRDHGRVILQSRDLDQHGRPIAHVWVEGKSIDQELLDQGLAVKVEE
jgi:endonuclease YncB( thermonuclease family)